ncbi:MAG: esterase, partial [Bacteroidales bacterium]|nr:esterase [Bacteroidales bacterium]
MKRLTIITICLLAFTGLSAQELANFAGRQPVISPEIKGSEITFRVSAPYADAVKLNGSWMADFRSAVDMIKEEAGLWSVTIPTPTAELYTYSFIVDGLSTTDPNNVLMQRDGTRYLSVLLVPGDATAN